MGLRANPCNSTPPGATRRPPKRHRRRRPAGAAGAGQPDRRGAQLCRGRSPGRGRGGAIARWRRRVGRQSPGRLMPQLPVPPTGAAARVIVTRPLQDAQHWVEQLQQGGFAAEALPLIDIAPASDTEAARRAWQALGGYAACMFVSGNAVEYFFKQKVAVAHTVHGHSAIKTIANDGRTCRRPFASWRLGRARWRLCWLPAFPPGRSMRRRRRRPV
jgi:hypothetical protein